MVDALALTQGTRGGVELLTTASDVFDLDVGGFDRLAITTRMTGAADGDLTQFVNAIEDDGTVFGGPGIAEVAQETSSGPKHSGGVVYLLRTYNVKDFSRVRIASKNNNAATKIIQKLEWHLA